MAAPRRHVAPRSASRIEQEYALPVRFVGTQFTLARKVHGPKAEMEKLTSVRFLRRIDRAVLKPRDVHLVLDNEADQKTVRGTVFPLNASHKTPEVKAWLSRHPRFKLHFTPPGASWLNLVERFFAEITSKRIRRGSYTSVGDVEADIYHYLGQHNTKPKPFAWNKTADHILTRERRALDKLDEIRSNR